MSHDFDKPRRRWERRVCKRCNNVYSALHVETAMIPPCRGEVMAPPLPVDVGGRRQPRLRKGPSEATQA
jgi:hypothetical protein